MIFPKRGDKYIVSYPKSGRTWLRSLIGKFLFDQAGIVPEKLDHVVNTEFWYKTGEPNIWFSHDTLHGKDHILGYPENIKVGSKIEYRNTKVVFLCRDPRDVLVSLYFQKVKREGRKGRYLKNLSTYIQSRRAGIDCIIIFMNGWSSKRVVPQDFMLLRYEDMVNNTEVEFRRLLSFFNISILKPELVKKVVNFSSFENMQKRERERKYEYDTTMLARNVNVPDTFKVRRGKVGGFIDYFSKGEIDFLNEKMKKLDPYFGYSNEI